MMELTQEICLAWEQQKPLDRLLARLVVETGARASGCWRLQFDHLVLVGFGWASDMPADVSSGFQQATRRVPIDQSGLGIVKAVVSNQPAIGKRDPQDSGLDGSATWITKFAANTSLAVPIFCGESRQTLGVIAVSTADFIEPGDAIWTRFVDISRRLSRTRV